MGWTYDLLAPKSNTFKIDVVINEQEDWLDFNFIEDDKKYYSFRFHAPESTKIKVVFEQLKFGLFHPSIPPVFSTEPYKSAIRKSVGWKISPFDFLPPMKVA